MENHKYLLTIFLFLLSFNIVPSYERYVITVLCREKCNMGEYLGANKDGTECTCIPCSTLCGKDVSKFAPDCHLKCPDFVQYMIKNPTLHNQTKSSTRETVVSTSTLTSTPPQQYNTNVINVEQSKSKYSDSQSKWFVIAVVFIGLFICVSLSLPGVAFFILYSRKTQNQEHPNEYERKSAEMSPLLPNGEAYTGADVESSTVGTFHTHSSNSTSTSTSSTASTGGHQMLSQGATDRKDQSGAQGGVGGNQARKCEKKTAVTPPFNIRPVTENTARLGAAPLPPNGQPGTAVESIDRVSNVQSGVSSNAFSSGPSGGAAPSRISSLPMHLENTHGIAGVHSNVSSQNFSGQGQRDISPMTAQASSTPDTPEIRYSLDKFGVELSQCSSEVPVERSVAQTNNPSEENEEDTAESEIGCSTPDTKPKTSNNTTNLEGGDATAVKELADNSDENGEISVAQMNNSLKAKEDTTPDSEMGCSTPQTRPKIPHNTTNSAGEDDTAVTEIEENSEEIGNQHIDSELGEPPRNTFPDKQGITSNLTSISGIVSNEQIESGFREPQTNMAPVRTTGIMSNPTSISGAFSNQQFDSDLGEPPKNTFPEQQGITPDLTSISGIISNEQIESGFREPQTNMARVRTTGIMSNPTSISEAFNDNSDHRIAESQEDAKAEQGVVKKQTEATSRDEASNFDTKPGQEMTRDERRDRREAEIEGRESQTGMPERKVASNQVDVRGIKRVESQLPSYSASGVSGRSSISDTNQPIDRGNTDNQLDAYDYPCD